MRTELNQLIDKIMTKRSEYEREVIKKAWSDEDFKQRFLNNPKSVIADEIGETLPENIEFEVLQETENTVYFVLPNNPIPNMSEEELSAEALESVAGGVCISSSKHYGTKKVAWTGLCYKNANDLV